MQTQIKLAKTGLRPIVDLSGFTEWDSANVELVQILAKRSAFWQNSELILRLGNYDMSAEQIQNLSMLLQANQIKVNCIQTDNSTLRTRLINFHFITAEIPNKIINLESKSKPLMTAKPVLIQQLPANSTEAMTALIGSNSGKALRGGQSIAYEGNLVILGDVNPGCAIKATGSVIVYGQLCGSIHAGFGKEEAGLENIFIKGLSFGEALQVSIGCFSAMFDENSCSTEERHKVVTFVYSQSDILRITENKSR